MRIPRRSLLAAGPLALAGCGQDRDPYFGNTAPPPGQLLVFETQAEPGSLDPALTVGPGEHYLLPSLFEGLTAYHPITSEPMAALATHYEVSADGTRYTFFLRGHRSPRGIRLPTTDDLPDEFTRGRKAAPTGRAARWSDGRPISAHDFVYSWQRAIAPGTGAFYGYLLHDLRNGREISSGKQSPHRLGVRATDDFALEVDLVWPAPYFPQLTAFHFFAAVPRQAISAAGPLWTDPRHIVTSGPFTLAEWRTHDRVRVVRNPHYYDAAHVALDEIRFVPFSDSNTLLHYYKAGGAQATSSVYSPLMNGLHTKRDFRTHRRFGLLFCTFNVREPPFDNPQVRHAFNMAIDKSATARWTGLGQTPARTLVPPLEAYQPPPSVPASVNGNPYDALAFDPAGARELLRAAGFDSEQTVDFLIPALSSVMPRAAILQWQWKRHLGVKVQVVTKELSIFVEDWAALAYKGIADGADYGQYTDPNYFLSLYLPGGNSGTGWTDSEYTALLARANAAADPAERMSRLAACEKHLLAAMPIMPLYYDVWSYFEKPYVRGCGSGNLVDCRQFKYAWIDTTWRRPP